MQYNLKGTGLSPDQHRTYIEKRLPALDKFFGSRSGVRADIEIEFLKDEEKKFRAEATLHDHGLDGDFRVEALGDTMHEAIDIMVNTLNLELSRAKKRMIHDKRKGAARFKDFIRGFIDRI
jgi:ribosomal subunit interface protein